MAMAKRWKWMGMLVWMSWIRIYCFFFFNHALFFFFSHLCVHLIFSSVISSVDFSICRVYVCVCVCVCVCAEIVRNFHLRAVYFYYTHTRAYIHTHTATHIHIDIHTNSTQAECLQVTHKSRLVHCTWETILGEYFDTVIPLVQAPHSGQYTDRWNTDNLESMTAITHALFCTKSDLFFGSDSASGLWIQTSKCAERKAAVNKQSQDCNNMQVIGNKTPSCLAVEMLTEFIFEAQ